MDNFIAKIKDDNNSSPLSWPKTLFTLPKLSKSMKATVIPSLTFILS